MKRFLPAIITSISLGLALFSTCSAEAASLDRVEPPFWWQGFKHQELQLLVHGDNIGDLTPSVEYPGVSVARVERVENQNYLFIYLAISDTAEPGNIDIEFKRDDLRFVHAYELRQRDPDQARTTGFTSADVIYMITPDRFVNGDRSNDTVESLGDAEDRSDDYGRHGGDIAGITQRLDYINDMGFTAVWLNPVLENAMPESSYHGYATTDFYAVDPRFGDNKQYLELAEKAREMGIGLIMDVILNHIGSEHWWMHDMPSTDWLNVPQQKTITSHARTSNQDIYASEFDKATFANGWFTLSMPDLNQRNPLLADYLIQNAIWWTEYLGLAGIRVDTYPYPDKHFMGEWTRRVMQEFPDFNITGEEWTANPAITSYWQRGKINHDGYVSHLPSLLDFPLQIAFKKSLTEEVPWWDSPWTSVYEMLGNDFLYPDPGNLVIFPDNHDMSRIYTQLGEDYDLYKMAMVYYLTMRGIPTLYYGTEVLMSHPGTESHGAIRGEFPGGWSDSVKNAFTGEGLTNDEQNAQQFVRKLLHWRKQKPAIHSGRLMQFAPLKSVYVYFRYDDTDTVMVIMNQSAEAQTLELPRFAERIGDMQNATDVITGRQFELTQSLELEPRSVLLLELEK